MRYASTIKRFDTQARRFRIRKLVASGDLDGCPLTLWFSIRSPGHATDNLAMSMEDYIAGGHRVGTGVQVDIILHLRIL